MPFDIAPGVLDPREVIKAINAVIPKDWDCVVGGGHQAVFQHPDARTAGGALHHGP